MPTLISGSTGVNKITDGTIVDADINASAAITGSKLVMPTGSVLQVVSSGTVSSVTASGSSGTNAYVTLASQAITPSSSSSTILVISGTEAGCWDGCSYSLYCEVHRGSTRISGDDTLFAVRDTGGNAGGYGAISVQDSPSTTSATTYYLKGKVQNAKTCSGYFRDCSITLMEIAG
mgnify:CR=1 FL=1